MRAGGGVLAVICVVIGVAGARVTRAQEATSANLPDQFQTDEMARSSKPKKKKAEATAQTLATAPKQNRASASPHSAPVEELPASLPPDEKKAEPSAVSAVTTPSHQPPRITEESAASEEPVRTVVPAEKRARPKKRHRPAPVAPTEPARISEPVPMSLSVAQSMAITAPLPTYPYEAKRRNLTGNGVCLLTVDSVTGDVTDATMSQSTGNAMLDKITIQTFKSWRFKPGTVSQVRLPISYE